MNIWLGTLGLMDTRYSCSGKDHDRYFLSDRRLSILWEEARVWVAEGIIVAVGVVDGERCIFWVQSCGCNGCGGARGGEVIGYDGQGKQRYVVFLGQADGGRGGGKSGSESAVEWCKGDAEIYDVVFNGGLDGVGFEDCILVAPSQLGRVHGSLGC